VRPTILLINPNTSDATTAMMVAIAQEEAADQTRIDGISAPFGAPLIVDEPALSIAAEAVGSLAGAVRDRAVDGVIVAAFGDPGLEVLRGQVDCPVTGIAEASMAEAARDAEGRPRRFSVITTTPLLVRKIERRATDYGYRDRFAGVRLTPGDPATLMADREALTEALGTACRQAVELDGAQALVIGGGPLALAARALQGRFAIPIVEPIPAAVRLALRRQERPARRD
jgi:allantoin racemase